MIEQPRTRSVSFFLSATEVRTAMAAATASDALLLDDPATAHATSEVTQAPFRAVGALSALTCRLATAAFSRTGGDACLLEELVARTAVAALEADLRLVRRGALASCARKSTRAELVARVVRARKLIEDRGGRVSSSKMASVACLSRYHFLRVFREVTGLTPAAYARQFVSSVD